MKGFIQHIWKNMVGEKRAPGQRRDFFLFSKETVFLAALAAVTRQTAQLTAAGLPLARALATVGQRVRAGRLARVFQDLTARLKAGERFSDGLLRYPGVFPLFYRQMVLAGEETGDISRVLERLADYLEKQAELRSRVTAACVYPGLILLAGLVTVVVLLTWVVPKISVIYGDLNAPLPAVTQGLMAVSRACVRYGWAAGTILLVGGTMIACVIRSPAGREQMDRFQLAVPLWRQWVCLTETANWATGAAVMLAGGVSLTETLPVMAFLTGNTVIRRELRGVQADVLNGMGVAAAFGRRAVFLPEAVDIIALGEMTGDLAKGFGNLERFARQRMELVERTTSRMLEPALIMGVGFFIGLVVVAALLPVFRINRLIM